MKYALTRRVNRTCSNLAGPTLTVAMVLFSPSLALAQAVTGGFSPQTMISNVCSFMLGPFGQSIAVVFIMALGVAWMTGRASLHMVGSIIGGIILLFGAAFLQQTITGSGS